jgi:hypothetical protein
MPVETFVASRLTQGNRLFPTVIEVGDTFVVKRTRTFFTKNEISIHLSRIASVRIETGVLWSDILIESSGGSDPIASHGHRKGDALRIKELIEHAQSRGAAASAPSADPGATRACPYCAETIKAAAKVCRYCGKEIRT